MPAGVPFGEYRLLKRLGSGGMAEVFLAKWLGPKGFQKQVVIKRILPHLSASERFVSMFLKEARIAALIDHPNLVHVSSFGEVNGNYYLAMEFVDGLTVGSFRSLLGTVTPGVACRIAVDLLDALQAIHSARDEQGEPIQLVHRDVSPRNVMLTRDGAVKLLDFGIAVSSADTCAGSPAGTRRHMSPEQMRGEPLDARSDLFCVGVLIYQLINGEPPFDDLPDHAPPRPPAMPPELWATVEKTLALERDARPASARLLQAELELFLATRGIEGTRAHLAQLVTSLMGPQAPVPRVLTRLTRLTRTGLRRLTSPLSQVSEAAPEGGARPQPAQPPEPQPSLLGEAIPEILPEGTVANAPAPTLALEPLDATAAVLADLADATRSMLLVQPQAPVETSPGFIAARGDATARFGLPPRGIPALRFGAGLVLLTVVAVLLSKTRSQVEAAPVVTVVDRRVAVAAPPTRLVVAPLRVPAPEPSRDTALTSNIANAGPAPDPRPEPLKVRAASRRDDRDDTAGDDGPQRPRTGPVVRKKKFGRLVIDATPWANVYYGDKMLGTTPLTQRTMPVGTYELELRNPQTGVRRVSVTIRHGRTTRVKAP